jgi:twitching motility two-component system response regulator PilH
MQKPFDRDEVYLRIGQLVRCGRLDGRLPSAPLAVEALPALVAELPADELADIPDIAMPDAEATPHLAGAAPLQVVHGIG